MHASGWLCPLSASPQPRPLRTPSAEGLLPEQKFLIQLAPQPQVMPDAKPDFKYLGGFNYVLDDDESQREESEKPGGLYPRTMTPRWEDVRKLATPRNGYPLNDNHDNIAFEQLLWNGTLDLQRRGDKQQIVPARTAAAATSSTTGSSLSAPTRASSST